MRQDFAMASKEKGVGSPDGAHGGRNAEAAQSASRYDRPHRDPRRHADDQLFPTFPPLATVDGDLEAIQRTTLRAS